MNIRRNPQKNYIYIKQKVGVDVLGSHAIKLKRILHIGNKTVFGFCIEPTNKDG